jgi:pimeloyl-ACP methyl ester carboxylesterase
MDADAPGDAALTQHRAGAGEPLVLLHGLGLMWRCWTPLLPALEAAHDVVALDLPGFGAAPPLSTGEPTVGALADAVEAELDRLALDAPHIAGNSLGGWIALELARRGRARSVVALAPAGLEGPAERLYVMSLNEWMRLRAKAAAPVARTLTANRISRVAALGALRGRPWRVPADEAAAEVRAFARAPGFQPTLRWTVGAQPALGLDAIDVPVRVCAGPRDVMLGAYTAPRFVAAIPRAELHPLPGCGHVPMADDPSRVGAAITGLTTAAR